MSVLSQYCILYNLSNNGQYYQSLLILLCCIIVLFYHCLCILWLCYNCCVINVCFIIILCTIHSVLSKSVNTFKRINTFCAYHRYRADVTLETKLPILPPPCICDPVHVSKFPKRQLLSSCGNGGGTLILSRYVCSIPVVASQYTHQPSPPI